MYDNNPTLPEIGINKPLEEIRQGEALGLEALEKLFHATTLLEAWRALSEPA